MKNITLAIDDDVLAKVRRIAAEKNTTVNALVREYLTRLTDAGDRAKRAREQLVKLAERSTWNPGPGETWSREALYDRPVLRGHERADLRGVGRVPGCGEEAESD